ncbi:class I SAM-dependent methyltransferase [Burkholderia sp. FERM BP-3421]|uniref:class I SAM-dependent methyltransferase n=1 Tax=Burkholderia sp. FERM BP-3421 TaxID=1494466 RepID=UPI002362DFAF|nr:class I SAM-dependent methyltransferase [Burkholderia sp. FERM BP-3421]WDD91346.1 class I SAM-dependent methyltransferase [Burkholderia sp. FERM BP-3421]
MREYVLGHSPTELKRLDYQSEMLRPITRRLLESAGIRPGMRVLDIGCGTGGVSLLAAELVGPTGSVTAIDRSGAAIETASGHAAEAGLDNLRFEVCALDQLQAAHEFDIVVGRYVLSHQPDATAFLQLAARFVRPGGALGFHEPDLVRQTGSSPSVALWDTIVREVLERCQHGSATYDVARRLVQAFAVAGLPTPTMSYEIPLGGGPASPLCSWLAQSLRTLSGGAQHTELASGETVDLDQLSADLQRALLDAQAQVEFPGQVCAWIRL